MRYRGSCHCGAVTFAFEAERITEGMRCNCSICRRRGAIMSKHYVQGVSIEGLDKLAVYRWGDHMMNHYFCPTCGIAPFSDVIERPGSYRINLGCLEDFDAMTVSVSPIDGASF
jgi:hypothetical protein